MSHEIRYFDFPENVDRKKVAAKCNHLAAMDDWREGCTGLSAIRWIDRIFESYEKAEEAIKQLDRGWYDCLAVKFRVNHSPVARQATKMLNDRFNKAVVAKRELSAKAEEEFFGAKSEFVGCKECGSKLNRRRLKAAKCAVCGNSLLSDTWISRIDKAGLKARELQNALTAATEKDLKKNLNKPAETRWLVKIEYHT